MCITGGESNDFAPLKTGPRYRVQKNSSFSCNLTSCWDIPKIHYFLFLRLDKVWLKDGGGMDDQEERLKNKKYISLKMFPSDIT